MNFHEKLYALRKASGMTQTDLAEKLDVSRQAVSRWEMGTAKPEVDTLIAISELFGVTLDSLLKDQKEPQEQGNPQLPRETADEEESPSIKWARAAMVLFVVGLGILLNVWFFTSMIGKPFPAVYRWAGGIMIAAAVVIGLAVAIVSLVGRSDRK